MARVTLVAGTAVMLIAASLIVHLYTGFSLPVLWGGSLAITLVMATLGWYLLSLVARGVAHMFTASGGLDRPREYSEQQALVVRGAYREAADSYRAHLVAFPDDQTARLRLAALLEGQLEDPAAAESLYLQVRAGAMTRSQRLTVGNGLIDLYRARGDHEQLRTELARLARDFAGTAAGEGARRLLRSAPLTDESSPA